MRSGVTSTCSFRCVARIAANASMVPVSRGWSAPSSFGLPPKIDVYGQEQTKLYTPLPGVAAPTMQVTFSPCVHKATERPPGPPSLVELSGSAEAFAKMPSNKTFKIKQKLAKKAKQNRPIPHWIRFRTDNTIRYNAKRRHWRRTKLGL